MSRFVPIALLALLAAAPAWRQAFTLSSESSSGAWGNPLESSPPLRNFRFSLPVGDYVEPDGSRTRQRGIIAGADIAPQTVVGIGFFDRQPRASGFAPDPALDNHRSRSRKAAVGISLRF